MDPLRKDDLERARSTSPERKLRQALDAMATGIRLKAASLRRRHPGASDEQLDALLRAWLERRD